jgi:hypothetical protein
VTQAERKALWDELLAEGWQPSKHYREHSVQELQDNLSQIRQERATKAQPTPDDFVRQAELDALLETPADTIAGIRTSTPDEKPIRIDETGKIWYRDYIPKPGYAKERGKRVLEFIDPGVRTAHVKDGNGSIVESFEVPGNAQRPGRATIALPSYQIGLYRDPALLGEFFKIHVYGDKRVFDFFDVEKYFGGRHQIPKTCKRDYADTMLGFDIDSVIEAIDNEYRDKVLKKEIKEIA